MAERLIVKKFGPIKEVDLDLQQTTIFIGEQASGKSTLAKLIGIFRNGEKVILLKANNKDAFSDYLINDFFKKHTFIHYISNKIEIVYKDGKFNFLKDNLSSLFIGNDVVENDLKPLSILLQQLEKEKSAKARHNIEREIAIQILKNGNSNIVDLIIKNFAIDIYVPAERTLIPMIAQSLFSIMDKGLVLSKMITGFGNEFEKARQILKEYEILFLNMKYQFENGKDRIVDNSAKIELQNASSGLQSLIPMLLVIEANSNEITLGNFIIEEPELNLYPTTQYDLTKFIVEKCTNKKHQLTITTHSPYLLSALNILLFAHQVGEVDEVATNKIIPKENWINPQKFAAYFLEKGGTARLIFDKEAGMISENELDNVSLNLGDEFDKLMDIYQVVSV